MGRLLRTWSARTASLLTGVGSVVVLLPPSPFPPPVAAWRARAAARAGRVSALRRVRALAHPTNLDVIVPAAQDESPAPGLLAELK